MTKILLVEDDNSLREIYGARLEAEGYEIVSAADGEKALSLALKERPDLIISDVMMPKVSGFDVVDILRQTPETKDTKIILMTALSQEEDKVRGEQLGADDYLIKSQVTLEDVVNKVSEVLARPPRGQEPTAANPNPNPVSSPAPAPMAATPAATPAPAAPAAPATPAPSPTPTPIVAEPPKTPAPINATPPPADEPVQSAAEPKAAPLPATPEPTTAPSVAAPVTASDTPASPATDTTPTEPTAPTAPNSAMDQVADIEPEPTTPTSPAPSNPIVPSSSPAPAAKESSVEPAAPSVPVAAKPAPATPPAMDTPAPAAPAAESGSDSKVVNPINDLSKPVIDPEVAKAELENTPTPTTMPGVTGLSTVEPEKSADSMPGVVNQPSTPTAQPDQSSATPGNVIAPSV